MKYLVLAFALVSLSISRAAATVVTGPVNQLVYFAQKGCPACITWERHVGHLYAKTDEGKRLPLERVDIDHRPARFAGIQGVHYTPTFVVLHCGHEVARILGYTSDFQFWGLLDRAIAQLPPGDRCS